MFTICHTSTATMDHKWNSKYSPGKKVSTHQYILELVCENLARKNGKELPYKFWELKEWKWNYIKQSNLCKELRDKHGDLKVLDFVKKKRIWSLKASWIDQALSDWFFSVDGPVKDAPKIDTVDEPTVGQKKTPKTNFFKGL